jgi:signal transduction histidine kinase
MSSGKRSYGLKTAAPADADGQELDRFYANLSHGLHAMGQPLTVIRGAAAACVAPNVTQEDQQRYLKTLADHAAVACGLYHCLRDLVAASQLAAICDPVELDELLAPVVEEQKAALLESGVGIEFMIPRSLRPILADKDRTLQALFAVLKIAASVSAPGDVIEVLVTHSDEAVALTVQNRRVHGKSLNSLERLSLALAEANIRSQRGGCECIQDPFRVTVTFPVEDVDPLPVQGAFQGELAHQAP